MIDLFDRPAPAKRGMSGHQSTEGKTEVWLTPPEILASLGRFDLDPCACMAPRPWPTASRHFTRNDNGLLRKWLSRVWLNPPYGTKQDFGPWMVRLADHGEGTALIFARTETEVFHATVWRRATAIFFFEGRLHFHRVDGTRAENNAGAPSVLVAYGAADAEMLRRCGLPGKYVPL